MSQKYPIWDDIQHSLFKTKDTGIHDRIDNLDLRCINEAGEFYRPKFLHSPCLLNLLNEPIVNCSDATIKGFGVKEIWITMEPETGIITVYNDGKGIDIMKHEQGSEMLQREVFVPEVVFTNFRCGSNLVAKDNHAVGGTNGLGIKLTNVHSDWLELETVDAKRKKIFKQKYALAEYEIGEPEIEDYKDPSYTQLRFLPTYKRFGYGKKPKPDEFGEFIDLIRYKLYLLSTFLAFKKVKVYLNDELIPVKSTKDLLNIVEPSDIKINTIKAQDSQGKFIDIAVRVRNGRSITTTMVNGTTVIGGTHITHFTRRLNKELKDIGKDKEKPLKCDAYLAITCVAWLIVKNWGDQTKTKLELKESDLKDFKFDDKKIASIAKQVIEASKVMDIRKTVKSKLDKKVLYEKYTPANSLGKIPSTLFLAEGDSAMLLLKRGLAYGDGSYNVNNTGIFSLGGVPMNIGKTMTEQVDEEGDEIEIASEKFYESKVFHGLIQTLKLDPCKKYKTTEEVATLAYKKIVICVDQDLDGRGNICSLVLQMFDLLWPSLLSEHAYVYHWNSPILRVLTTKGKLVKDFKYESEYKKWAEREDIPKNLDKPVYIKGLAGHDDKYIKAMFQDFEGDLIKMTANKKTRKQFDVYFGKNSKARKSVLSTPLDHFTEEDIMEMENTKELLCQRHLSVDTKEFMCYAMKRTIPAMDGLTPVRRKALMMMIKHWVVKAMKIFQLTGRVAYEFMYHHGDASMNGAITRMAQAFPGSNNYPLLSKDGQVGSRNMKGKDFGSPRYVSAFLNTEVINVLYPKDDIPVLPKKYDDGQEVEPKYFIPVLPMPILEMNKSVSYAWCLLSYPRDITAVCKLLIKLCKGEEITDADKLLPPHTRNYTGEITIIDNIVSMKGVYKLEGRSVYISELPFTVTPQKYHLSMVDDENVVDVMNNTTDSVQIKIEFKVGALEKIHKKYSKPAVKGGEPPEDPLRDFLKIDATMNENFNFINEDNVIEHFDTAYDVLYRCFMLNQKKYKMKIDREILLLTYYILCEENIIHFIDCDEIERVKRKSIAMMDETLKEDKFIEINTTALNTHMKYTTEELNELLTNDSKCSYSYLHSIRVSDVSNEELIKRTKKLEEYEKRKKELEKMLKEKPFPGAKQYMKDIKHCHDQLIKL